MDKLIEGTPFALHTHDRIAFKRCRRKWYFSSPLHLNLQPLAGDANLNLWFGSGFHFALEDYHGYNKFGAAEVALEAYYDAFRANERPDGADEMLQLGMNILQHYRTDWLPKHNFDGLETLWITPNPGVALADFSNHPLNATSVPQVEVSFTLELKDLTMYAGFPIYYHGTFDRVMIDKYDRWWLLDYKTAKAIDLDKLATDPQISAYLWAAEQYFQHPIEGIMYAQFAKDYPLPPRELAKGGFSQDKRQKTTHAIYKKALLDKYGEVPGQYMQYLNELACAEFPEGNRFIRWDGVRRNDAAKKATYHNIILEGMDMIDTHRILNCEGSDSINCRLYPNPTRDCKWDCPFRCICLAMDEGSDYQYMIDTEFEKRNETMLGEQPEWQKRIKWPDAVQD